LFVFGYREPGVEQREGSNRVHLGGRGGAELATREAQGGERKKARGGHLKVAEGTIDQNYARTGGGHRAFRLGE